MSSDAVFSAVRDLITAQWSTTEVVWPNEGGVSDASLPWIYVDVSGNLLDPMELGGGAWIERGLVFCSVFVPVGTGTLEQRAIAKAMSDLFRNARDGPVVFRSHNLGQGEPGDDDGMYWRLTLTVEYSYEDR